MNAAEPSQRQTALMWAAAERHADVVGLLVEAGADLRARTKKGFTALHFAAREGDIESVTRLLAAGVDVNIRSQPDSPETGTRRGLPIDPIGGEHAAARGHRPGAGAGRPLSAGPRCRPERR